MSRLFFISATAVIFALCFRPSFENRTKQACSNGYSNYKCRRRNQVCCNGTCNSTCIGKRCFWDVQCSSLSHGLKCCAGRCQRSCEGLACEWSTHCKDRSMKCCSKICRRDSCLGSACNSALPAYRTCGWHRGARLQCCNGQCELSCRDKPCFDNTNCGGGGRTRMKCCNGLCKPSCAGSPCFEHRDCQSHRLDCCGVFENRTCARSCINQQCSLADKDECGKQGNPRLFCCGDGTCRRTCEGSICYTETFRDDCRTPTKILYCCGMGEKKCRLSCSQVICEKNEDCGKSKYYCGMPDAHNITKCRYTYIGDFIQRHDVRLDDLYND